MDLFTREDLRSLLPTIPSPCVSLLMPTTRGVAHEDKIRWKNLVREAEERLLEQGKRRPDAEQLLKPADDLLLDTPFWLNASAGLAVFLAPGLFRDYRVPVPLDEKVIVAERFQVKPLLPVLADNQRFYVLALSQKQVALYQGTRFTVQEVDLQEVPHNLREALSYNDEVKVRTFHTHTAAGGPAGRREAIVHGQGTIVDSAKAGLLEYFQMIDRGLQRILHNEQAPLVLAAVDFLLPIYREANSYPHLLDEGILGNPGQQSTKDLHDRAWAIVQPHFQDTQNRMAALYRELAGTGRTTNDLGAVVAAAHQGQIQYLFATLRNEQWGTFDPANGKSELHATCQPGDEDLVNLAVVHTLLHKGTVFVVEPEEAPDTTPLAALFWLPLGQRRAKDYRTKPS